MELRRKRMRIHARRRRAYSTGLRYGVLGLHIVFVLIYSRNYRYVRGTALVWCVLR